MIGIHGAGLNMFQFMPFDSVVVEIHKGTTANKNARNFVNHINEGKYLTMSVSTNNKELDVMKIWDLLKKAIEEWEKLPVKRSKQQLSNPTPALRKKSKNHNMKKKKKLMIMKMMKTKKKKP